MNAPRDITVMRTRDGFSATVRETDAPGTWELTWTGTPDPGTSRRTLRNADAAVLRSGGERLAVSCPPDQEGMWKALEGWLNHGASRTGDRWLLELIVTANDGFVHDDDDFRTPLYRLTCPTCVDRIAHSRSRNRRKAFGKGSDQVARHTRLTAEAYARLAEIEEGLNIPGPSRDPDPEEAQPEGEQKPLTVFQDVLEQLVRGAISRREPGDGYGGNHNTKWLEPLLEKIRYVSWDMEDLPYEIRFPKYGAPGHLVRALAELLDQDDPAPQEVAPNPAGGLTARWHTQGYDAQVECRPDGSVLVSFRDPQGNGTKNTAEQTGEKLKAFLQSMPTPP